MGYGGLLFTSRGVVTPERPETAEFNLTCKRLDKIKQQLGVVVLALIPALGRQRQVDLYEFEASLVYRVSSRTVRATQRNPVWKKKRKKGKEKRNPD